MGSGNTATRGRMYVKILLIGFLIMGLCLLILWIWWPTPVPPPLALFGLLGMILTIIGAIGVAWHYRDYDVHIPD